MPRKLPAKQSRLIRLLAIVIIAAGVGRLWTNLTFGAARNRARTNLADIYQKLGGKVASQATSAVPFLSSQERYIMGREPAEVLDRLAVAVSHRLAVAVSRTFHDQGDEQSAELAYLRRLLVVLVNLSQQLSELKQMHQDVIETWAQLERYQRDILARVSSILRLLEILKANIARPPAPPSRRHFVPIPPGSVLASVFLSNKNTALPSGIFYVGLSCKPDSVYHVIAVRRLNAGGGHPSWPSITARLVPPTVFTAARWASVNHYLELHRVGFAPPPCYQGRA